MIRAATPADLPALGAMRHALWPDGPAGEHQAEAAAELRDPRWGVLIACDEAGVPVGFVEMHLRDVAEECASSPVAYVEGWYVSAAHRRRGVGRALMEAGAAWGRARGCTEMASDVEVGNIRSRAAHARLGFAETGALVHFRRDL